MSAIPAVFKPLLCLLIPALCLLSCREKILNAQLPYPGDRLVVYAELSPDTTARIYISRTYPPTGSYSFVTGVAGATVEVVQNGTVIEQLVYADSGRYVGRHRPVPTAAYSFRVSHPLLPTISTEPVVIPVAPVAMVIKTAASAPSPLGGSDSQIIAVEWQKQCTESAFTIVRIQGFYQDKRLAVNTFDINAAPDTETECRYQRGNNVYLFNQTCFSGQRIQTRFGLETTGFLQQAATDNLPGLRRDVENYVVSVRAISPSYESFLRTQAQPEELLQAFQPPTARYSNVRNGYGVVVAYNAATFTVKSGK